MLALGAVGVGVGLGALQPGAQPGDRFFQRAQLRLVGGGERGGMPAVVVAELGELVAGGLVAGAGGGRRGQRGVALGARGGDRGLGFCLGLGDLPGGIGADLTGLLKRRGAVVIRGGGAGFGVSAGGLGGFHGGDGLGGGGAGFGRLSLGACARAAWAARSARAASRPAAVSARTASACASAASGLAAASWPATAPSWPSAPSSWADSRVMAASTSSRMAAARVMAVVRGRPLSLPGSAPASSWRRRNAVSAVWVTSAVPCSPRSSATVRPQ